MEHRSASTPQIITWANDLLQSFSPDHEQAMRGVSLKVKRAIITLSLLFWVDFDLKHSCSQWRQKI